MLFLNLNLNYLIKLLVVIINFFITLFFCFLKIKTELKLIILLKKVNNKLKEYNYKLIYLL
jgi:hypothetical protein